PKVFYEFINVALENEKLDDLRYVIFGGDALNLLNLKPWFNKYGDYQPKLVNMYGITETAVHVTYKEIYEQDADKISNIGKAIPDQKIYVLDKSLNPLPTGSVGELYIGGTGLARGYLNLQELTKESFLPNPFQTDTEKQSDINTRMYKTGDLVRYLPNGDLEYIGRNDFQVKIRGYRIELSEIESVLNTYPGIKNAVVIAKETVNNEGLSPGNKYLVAYYVSDITLDEEKLLFYLSNKLPEYMIPNVFVYLNKLPLTINGKLDRNLLPAPNVASTKNYLAPRNDLEAKILTIFTEVLNISNHQISITDNIFKFGADSITSIQIVNKLRQRLNLSVRIEDIFNHKTIRDLYDKVISKIILNDIQLSILSEGGNLSGEVPMLPIQQWFWDQVYNNNFVEAAHWNQSFLIKTQELEIEILRQSIKYLINYHDSFRLNYITESLPGNKKDSFNCKQYYAANIIVPELKILDLNGPGINNNELQSILTSWQNNFDLASGQAYSIGYIYGYADRSSRIFFAIHHLLVDSVSWRIIAEDLQLIYNHLLKVGCSKKDDISIFKLLGAKGTSYRQWASVVKEYGIQNKDEANYWHRVMHDYDSTSKIAVARLVESENSRTETDIKLDNKYTRLLLTKSNHVYNTQINDLLLAGLCNTLYELTGSQIQHILLEGHGREEINPHVNINRTVGWFTTMYPVRFDLTSQVLNNELGKSILNKERNIDTLEIAGVIKIVKDSLRAIPNKGIGYGAIFGYVSDSLPGISFNYLGQFGSTNSATNNIQLTPEAIEKLQQVQNWQITGERSGINSSKLNYDNNIININGYLIDGILQFNIVTQLGDKNTTKFAELFQNKLIELIDYTSNETREYLTRSDIDNIISQDYLDSIQAKKDIAAVFLANSLQQGFIYHTLHQAKDSAYRIQLVFDYNNEIEPDRLRKAWQKAVNKYPGLRLRFAWHEELVQIVDKYQEIDWTYLDISQKQANVQTKIISNILKEDRIKSYDLEYGNLLRVHLIKQANNKYSCIVSAHHAILDGWSTQLLLKFVNGLYSKLGNNLLKITGIDKEEVYIKVQKYLQSNTVNTKGYWQNQINTIDEYPDLRGWLKSGVQSTKLSEYRKVKEHKEYNINISGLDYKKLKEFSYRYNITINTIIEYVWHKLLSVYGNTTTTVVGTTVSGRNLNIDNISESVGLYINTLPLIVKHDGEKTIIDTLREIQNSIFEMNNYSNVNLVDIQKEGSRLFDSLFVYENYPVFAPDKMHDDMLKIGPIKILEELDYPLGLVIHEQDNKINIELKYAGELFSQETIKDILTRMIHLISQITDIQEDSKLVKELTYLSKEEYQKIVYDWNRTEKDYPRDKTIHQLFEEQVERTPNNIAVVYKDIKLTYIELNKRSNQLAHYLRDNYQIKGDDLIALCLNRSEYILIAILGVFKSGAAYVPIDPDSPIERITYILEDTKAKALITDSKFYSHIDRTLYTDIIILNDKKFKKILINHSIVNLKTNITSKNLAYIIYTSGTTGKPKGVMIEHISVINLIYEMVTILKLNNFAKVTQFSNYIFDASIYEFFPTLSIGGTLYLLSKELTLNPRLLFDYYKNNNISHTFMSTAYYKEIYNMLDICKHNLKIVYIGGESIRGIKNIPRKYKLLNQYGPTETSVCVTQSFIDDLDYNYIGKSLSNITTYVLDKNYNPIPIGGIGELYIGGVALARGYLGQLELTKEYFVDNIFQTIIERKENKNYRLYRTGDLARYLPDGNLEYISRNDSQVKIRGYRIELSEIESVLNNYKGIKQSVVIVEKCISENNTQLENKYIVAYYVALLELNEKEILSYLATQLPEYMIPNALIWIKKIPLTSIDKLDKSALPKYQITLNNDYLSPRNIAEFKICNIYAEILNLPADQVGIKQDFFKLGGNSILAIKLLYRLQQEFKISLNDIFKLRTPAKIANLPPYNISLYNKLKQIKSVYEKLSSYKINIEMQKKKADYLQEVKQINFTDQLKNINNVLLTGATGHLGCHILYQLLNETKYRIYLLIRAGSNSEAFNRVNKKFKYYFDIGLEQYRSRIIVFAANIEKPDLDIQNKHYKELIISIDSIIHAAALVKHYGNYSTFYRINVQATINLLELAKQTKLKDFHYISTLSVLTNCYIPNYHYCIWTENDEQTNLKPGNVYNKTKYEGELATIKYRKSGVNSNIYRVGNLAINSKNYRNQENIEENAFFIRVKTILDMGIIPEEIAKVEISPVDYTALAIIRLFDKIQLINKTYHVANPRIYNLSNLFSQCNNLNIKTVAFDEFIDAMLIKLNNKINHERIERFMLHQMWLEEISLKNLTQIIVLQDKTNLILDKLNFTWPEITAKIVSNVSNQKFMRDKKMKKKEPIFEYLESIAELIPAPFYWLDTNGHTIGLNTLVMKGAGALSKSELIGKTPYEMYKDKSIADNIQMVLDKVIQTGGSLQTEDKIIDVTTGKFRYYSATRAPLRNKKNEIIGVVGTSIEVTAQKEAEQLKFEAAANKAALIEKEKLLTEKEKIIVKKEADRLKHENTKLEAENKMKQMLLEKEAAEKKAVEKEAERLKLENELQKQKLENERQKAILTEQELFRKFIGQIAHDIRSPLSSLRRLVDVSSSIMPEAERITLRKASMRISDIAHNMLNQYKNQDSENEVAEPVLASTAMLEILGEKRYEFNTVNFNTDFLPQADFAFIQVEPGQFKRMLSNLINNAVEALENKTSGVVDLSLNADNEWVMITITDNGKGIPPELVKKIEKGITVTKGKEHGFGIGLTQIHETVKRNFGEFQLFSTVGVRTSVLIKFPRIHSPLWIAEEIKITKDDIILILDDDSSIHGAWDSRLTDILVKIPELKVKHFWAGLEVVNFINSMPAKEKNKVCLLTDYELLNQDINGLQVIEQTKIKRSTLVTSHYANLEVRKHAADLYVKILPKELAFKVPINLDKKIKPGSKKVDIVWVDDSRWFIRDWKLRLPELAIDAYYEPNSFLEDIAQYPRNTKIILDRNYYDREGRGRKFLGDGLEVAKKLHEMGYTKLFMVTGDKPGVDMIDGYLKVIFKEDDEKIKEIIKL
ncbi:MAG: amino acid adenylation protein, partial [Burkholderiales bacterium]|nr:amino acid adenylation protein [Burkholderiales bacterium]